jgi:hypothetical protein
LINGGHKTELSGVSADRCSDFDIWVRLYYVDQKIELIAECFTLEIAKNLNPFGGF